MSRYGRLLARADDDVRGVQESPISKQANGYNRVSAENVGDSNAAANRIDSTIPPSDRLSPGSGGGLRVIEGIGR